MEPDTLLVCAMNVRPSRARATDAQGNIQPASVAFNEQGYLYNAVVGHPVTVA